jgi:hypothetical protein
VGQGPEQKKKFEEPTYWVRVIARNRKKILKKLLACGLRPRKEGKP